MFVGYGRDGESGGAKATEKRAKVAPDQRGEGSFFWRNTPKTYASSSGLTGPESKKYVLIEKRKKKMGILNTTMPSGREAGYPTLPSHLRRKHSK